MKCVKCGSSKIMTKMTIEEFGHGNVKRDLSIKILKTDRAFFNKYEKSKILTDICGNCGHMEFKVANPKELWQVYSKK